LQLHHLIRYAPVLHLIRELRSGTVLDVGSGEIVMAELLDQRWQVTALEYKVPDALRNRADVHVVEGDARSLPFCNREFDVVVAVDVLEHIPPEDRQTVLRELARVAARRLIVAGPAGDAARRADAFVAAHYEVLPGWLEEHQRFGLPTVDELVAPLNGARVMPNANARLYALLMRTLETRVGWHAQNTATRLLSGALCGRWAPSCGLGLLRGFDLGGVYRTIIVVDR
jgi:hypothetical protein